MHSTDDQYFLRTTRYITRSILYYSSGHNFYRYVFRLAPLSFHQDVAICTIRFFPSRPSLTPKLSVSIHCLHYVPFYDTVSISADRTAQFDGRRVSSTTAQQAYWTHRVCIMKPSSGIREKLRGCFTSRPDAQRRLSWRLSNWQQCVR